MARDCQEVCKRVSWDHRYSTDLKNWCFQTVVLKKTLESPLDSKEIQPVNPKGNQSWLFFGRTDAEAEAPILWSSDVKSQLIRKDPNAGKDWAQEEKGATEDEMVGWHHLFNGHEFEFEQTLGDSEGQGSWCAPVHGVEGVGHGLLTEQQLLLCKAAPPRLAGQCQRAQSCWALLLLPTDCHIQASKGCWRQKHLNHTE